MTTTEVSTSTTEEPVPFPRWKVVYDQKHYVVYVLIEEEAAQTETPDEQEKIMQWAKGAISMFAPYDQAFMVIEVGSGHVKGVNDGWDNAYSLRGILPIQGSGGPEPSDRWYKWAKKHKAAAEGLSIELVEIHQNSEKNKTLPWLAALMDKYEIYF